MKVGFAVQTNEGIESKVFNHFGSAPVFIIVDAAGKEIKTVNNQDLNHVHGACNPIKALDGQSVGAMVVGGIGAGALSKLNAMGIKVYGFAAATVKGTKEVAGPVIAGRLRYFGVGLFRPWMERHGGSTG